MIQFDNDICHLTFTHSDCKDIWPAYFGETKKFLKSNMPHYVCVDRKDPALPEYVRPLLYNPADPYPKRLHSCLEQLRDYEIVFFDHEDMFLYAEPNYEDLLAYYHLIQEKKLDHIRLIKGGFNFSKKVTGVPTLRQFSLLSKWIFSIQPSFWRRTVLMKVLEENLFCNIWDLERRSQKAVKKLRLKAAYSQTPRAKRRGWFHFDNTVYPYIATAIGKGKWNFSEYQEELGKVFSEYNIDPNVRGIN